MNKLFDYQKKLAERDFDLAVLHLWVHAENSTGRTWKDIKAFTFRPEFLTKEEKRENDDHFRRHRKPLYCDKNWHNCVRLVEGGLMRIPGIKRPTPPEWMQADVKRVVS